jgi:hypothetical protein
MTLSYCYWHGSKGYISYRRNSCNPHLSENYSGIRNDATMNERIKKMFYKNGELFTHNQ